MKPKNEPSPPADLPTSTIEIDELGPGAYFADWPTASLAVWFLLDLGVRCIDERAERFELYRGYRGEGGVRVVEVEPWLQERETLAFARAIVRAVARGQLNAGEVRLGGTRGPCWLECVQRAPSGLISLELPPGWQDGFPARFEAARATVAERLKVAETWGLESWPR
jgi:hypothetical protein